MTTVRCPHCGTANRAGSNYCNHCGAALSEADTLPPTTGTAANPAPPPESKSPDPIANAPAAALESIPPAWAKEQPWLQTESPTPAEGTATAPQPTDEELGPPTARRLVSNVQGLLDPLRLFSTEDLTAEDEIRSLPLAMPLPIDGGQMRRLRTILTTLPALEELGVSVRLQRLPSLRIPWIFWLIGLAIGLPVFLRVAGPLGTPRLWPGVTEAYLAVQDLPAGSTVLFLWAYDPATASEMDLLAEPLVIHLLEQQLQPIVVTLLPNGSATARHLFQQARQRWFASQNLQLQATDAPQLAMNYLPGPTALALLGQNLGVALTGQLDAPQFPALRTVMPKPALTVVVAAQADAVRQGLEQMQTLSGAPVVAFVGAGADLVLRPYLESGQLRGLVSGFDGAYGYQALRAQAGNANPGTDLTPQVVAQNWGHLALLLVILLGNLAALWGGQNR